MFHNYFSVCSFVPSLSTSSNSQSMFSVSTMNSLVSSSGMLSFLHFITATLSHYFTAGGVNIAHNTTTRLTCHSSTSIPSWCMNGSPVFLAPLYQLELDPGTGDFLGLLTIDGNEASGILDLCCVVEGRTLYTKRLATEGL